MALPNSAIIFFKRVLLVSEAFADRPAAQLLMSGGANKLVHEVCK